MADGYQSLTDKEKDTLRLLLRGYDAKSIARHFELSVHTVNERLRNARQKMAVSSSREAARQLLKAEGNTPQNVADKIIGEANNAADAADMALPGGARKPGHMLSLAIIGGLTMSFILAAFALTTLSPETLPASADKAAQTAPQDVATPAAATENETILAARQWLALVDAHDWAATYAASGKQFREQNTKEKFAEVAQSVQPKLGATLSRTFQSQEFVPAPPSGYEMVKFRTQFAAKPDTVETLALSQEDGKWRVVGYWLNFDGQL
ncbi:DUF4019 domain-containing protein [Sphingorhabdus arenilitoris]|uniref:DUF4019 domain-containing protein n=1 Tax=Sphingorhabdus arenilitoris TaxID=1490041 RepID=A0ABV8RLX7_9SPHN